MRICAVIIETTDLAGLSTFYREAFGLAAPSHVQEDHLGFTLDNTYLGFDRVPAGARARHEGTTPWFEVDDARAWHARLLGLGATDHMPPDECASDGEILAVVRDPEGNRIGLLSSVARAS